MPEPRRGWISPAASRAWRNPSSARVFDLRATDGRRLRECVPPNRGGPHCLFRGHGWGANAPFVSSERLPSDTSGGLKCPPEIRPDEARAGGASIIATGRSDFPNQANDVLAFPGIFRGALDARAPQITDAMKAAAAHAIAHRIEKPDADHILPAALDPEVRRAVARAVAEAAMAQARHLRFDHERCRQPDH